MRFATRLYLASALLICLLIPRSTSARTSDDTSTVVAVEVPVQVLLDGRPVRGLTRDNFEIVDERKPRKISSFEMIDLTESTPMLGLEEINDVSAQRVPLPARRHFLILFDLAFAQPQAVVKAREAATNLVRNQLHPTDLVAVATYSGVHGVRLLHGFTSDRARTAFAIETLGAPQLVRSAPDPLGLLFGGLQGSIRAMQNQGRGGAARTEALLDFTRSLERQERRQLSERIIDLSASFADLAYLLDNAPGRKHVLYLSEGFDTSVLFGSQDREAQQRMNQAIEDGRIWEVDSDERFGDAHSQNQLENMLEAFRRADCTLQTIQIGGLNSAADVDQGNRRDFERSRATLSGQDDALSLMAGATGGQYIRNFNDLGNALGEVLERTSLTYVLTFQPTDLTPDGKFRRLKVRLKNGPKRAQVVHRPGYYAPRPFAATDQDARRLRNAELLLGGEEGGTLELSALAIPALPSAVVEAPNAAQQEPQHEVQQGLQWVSVLLALDGAALTGRRSRGAGRRPLEFEVYAYALDDTGTVHDYLSHVMTIDPAQADPQLVRGGLQFFGHLDLPPGDYNLRILVRDTGDGAYGLRQRRLQVPSYAAGDVVILQPLFFDTPGQALIVRENMAPGEPLPAYPFLLDGQPFLPAVPPRVAPDVAVNGAVFLHGFTASPRLSAHIYRGNDATSAEANPTNTETNVTFASPTAGPEPGVWRVAFTLHGTALPPGSYQLEVRADDTSHRTPFEIIEITSP